MRADYGEQLRRSEEFEANQRQSRANKIETMIAELERVCIDLGLQIDAEELRTRINDPSHFAYPTYAKAARERCEKLQRSVDALKDELSRLRSHTNGPSNRQYAA